jgi:Lamin Tail Domain
MPSGRGVSAPGRSHRPNGCESSYCPAVRSRLQLAIVAALGAAALAPAAASASPAADLAAVTRDYTRDQRITPCRFTQSQLEGARSKIGADIASYAAGIDVAIAREIQRWKDRGCAGKRRAVRLRIIAVSSSGGANVEYVTIKNVGSKTVNLHNYALRDSDDHTLKLRATKLKKGAKLRVVTGCHSGRSGAVRRGTRYYACRKTQFWDDAGDVVELLAPGGGLLSQKRY